MPGYYRGDTREADCIEKRSICDRSTSGCSPCGGPRLQAKRHRKAIRPAIDLHSERPCVPRQRAPLIQWSGITWTLKDLQGARVGPGPNVFASDPANVHVDERGWLHLKISHQNGRWQSAEVVADAAVRFGYGTYEFVVDNADKLATNEVLGLFTWDNSSSAEHNREIDIELSRAFKKDGNNEQFTVQPWTQSANQDRFRLPDGAELSIQSFTWNRAK